MASSLAAAASLLLSAAISLAASSALARSGGATIAGTLDVSVTSPALKHWGVPSVAAAFVPDADHGAYAQRIRSSVDADALCAALAQVEGNDPAIASAHAEGDGDLEHRSGDEMRLVFRIGIEQLAAPARGLVYVCSSPIVAVVSRGNYPDERFEAAGEHRIRWVSRPLTLRPGEEARVLGTASIDASQW